MIIIHLGAHSVLQKTRRPGFKEVRNRLAEGSNPPTKISSSEQPMEKAKDTHLTVYLELSLNHLLVPCWDNLSSLSRD